MQARAAYVLAVSADPAAALRIARLTEKVASTVTLIGPPRFESLGFRLLPEPDPEEHPLAAMTAALEDSAARWNLIVSSDFDRLSCDFLDLLFRTAETTSELAVLPIRRDNRPEPLCGVYSQALRAPLADAAQRGIAHVERAVRSLNVRYVIPPEYQRFDPDGLLFERRPGFAEKSA